VKPMIGREERRAGDRSAGEAQRREAEPMITQTETAPIDKTKAAWDAKPRLSCAAA
jgi:hypothetical protein